MRVTSSPPGARPVRVTKRRAQTRARLLTAAFTVAAERGLGHMKIEDVCAAAGYTRGAFYSQFDSLEELLFALYDDQVQTMTQRIVDELAGAPHGKLRTQVERIADALPLDRDQVLVQAEFRLRAARDPDLAARMRSQREELLAAVQRQLQPVIAELDLPATLGTVADAALAAATAYDGVAAQLIASGDAPGARAWLIRMLTALLDPGRSPGPGVPAEEPRRD